jgi:hypothetical protein
MILPIKFILAAICTAQPQTYRFQSETVPHKDMARGEIVVKLMEIAARGTETMHAVVRFDHPIDTPTREQLIDGGLAVLNPIGGSSYIAAIDPWLVDPPHPLPYPQQRTPEGATTPYNARFISRCYSHLCVDLSKRSITIYGKTVLYP